MTPRPTIGLLVHADQQHGVAEYARLVAERAVALGGAALLDFDAAIDRFDTQGSQLVHAHFTDRLWGPTPAAAADNVERLASSSPITVTLHDVPQASDGRSLPARIDCYRRVVDAASAIAVNSEHERTLLEDVLDLGSTVVTVIPLPVERRRIDDGTGSATERASAAAEVAILGFFYPGKGHAEVVEAVAAAKLDARVVALGRVSDGHYADLHELDRRAQHLGVPFDVTGYLEADEMARRCRDVAVPVIAHRHFSASASLAFWIGVGRRPIVVESRYTVEMSRLRPGTMTLVAESGLAGAIANALEYPETTRLTADVDTRPHPDDTVADYRAWWAEVAS